MEYDSLGSASETKEVTHNDPGFHEQASARTHHCTPLVVFTEGSHGISCSEVWQGLSLLLAGVMSKAG